MTRRTLPLVVLGLVLVTGCDAVAPDASPPAVASASAALTGPDRVEPGCGAFYSYTGSEPGAYEVVSGSQWLLYFIQNSSYGEAGAGYTANKSFTVGYRSTSGTLLASKSVLIRSGGACES